MKLIFNAIIKTRAPLHIAHPDNLRMDKNGNRVYDTKDSKELTFPCGAIQKMTMLVPHAAASDRGEAVSEEMPAEPPLEGQAAPVADGKKPAKDITAIAYPVIAANNVAGRMRRYAAKHVLEALRSAGQKVSLDVYSILMCGAASRIPDGKSMTFAEYRTAREHPYFGLFGGGPKMFPRRVRIHNALPITPLLCDLKGSLSHPDAKEHLLPDNTRFTRQWGFKRIDDLGSLANMTTAEQSIADFEVQLGLRQEEMQAAAKRGESASQKNYSSLEFVSPGVAFDLTMELDVANDAQVGLYLRTLASFASEERLGGYVRNGFGVFSLESVVMTTEDGKHSTTVFNNGILAEDNDDTKPYLAAWAQAAKALSAASLERIIHVVEKPVKAKKGEKAGVVAETAEA